jgi:hypothetical protein
MKDSTNPQLYVPLRYANIRKVEAKGEYTYFYFSPEEFVKYTPSYLMDHYSDAVSSRILPDERQYLVGETEVALNVDKATPQDELNTWDALTKLLAGTELVLQKVSRSIFLGNIEITDPKSNRVEPEDDGSGFKLKIDTEYRFRLLVVIPNASKRGLNFDPFQFQIEGPFSGNTSRILRVTSHYDQLELPFRSMNTKSNGSFAILPKPVEVIGDRDHPLYVPSAQIPSRVSTSIRQTIAHTILPLTFITVGLLLEGLASVFPADQRFAPITTGTILGAIGLFFKK